MVDTGPNYPAIIRRSADDVAEARITHAEHAAWKIMDSLDADTKERLYGLLEQ